MYGYDPILLEKRELNEWLNESDDNILLVFNRNSISFSKSRSSIKNNILKKKTTMKKFFV